MSGLLEDPAPKMGTRFSALMPEPGELRGRGLEVAGELLEPGERGLSALAQESRELLAAVLAGEQVAAAHVPRPRAGRFGRGHRLLLGLALEEAVLELQPGQWRTTVELAERRRLRDEPRPRW